MPMQEFIGSVRQSLVFRPSTDDLSGIVEKIGSRIGFFTRTAVNALPLPPMDDKSENEPRVTSSSKVREEVAPLPPKIRWKKGELIGCGAFGRVYMGMNFDSGELLAVKEVAIQTKASSKKTQEYIQEVEKEVNLLKNLSHPNIVRYLGTVGEDDSFNILLEFVSGGSIASLLGNFGSFPESVTRMYTKQLLLGLEYLHKNKIIHRDMKGANILVDDKGCIKLADFGASKKVEALATATGAKSMKATPYWMAPEVIVQSGHSYPADIWSVGCTVIEMATGKAPWSQQYQEVAAALFHVGTTKAHPPIPDHLSAEAKDFLLKCLQKEPDLRPTASELLEHSFVTGECWKSSHVLRTSPMLLGISRKLLATGTTSSGTKKSMKMDARMSSRNSPKDSTTNHPHQLSEYESLWNFDDDLVRGASMKSARFVLNKPSIKNFNNTSVPKGDSISCKFDGSPELNRRSGFSDIFRGGSTSIDYRELDADFTFPREQSGAENDDEVTESKILAFILEKENDTHGRCLLMALELKKLQTPLYEFDNSLNLAVTPSPVVSANKENAASNCNLSGNRGVSRRLSSTSTDDPKPGRRMLSSSSIGGVNFNNSSQDDVREILLHSPRDSLTLLQPGFSESEIQKQKKWKEQLDKELQREREKKRQSGAVKTSSRKDLLMNKHKERFR